MNYVQDYSHLTGLLKLLNDEELKELLNNDEKLKALVQDSKPVQDIEAEKEILLTSNKSISEYNLSRKPILEEHQKQVQETREIALTLKASLLEKKKKIENCQQATSQDTLLALLQAATSEKEEEADAAVEQFFQKELDIEDFLEKFLEIRKVAHLRRIKSEKMVNILQENGSRALINPPVPQRLRRPPAPPTQLPYPGPNYNNNFTGPVRQAPQPPPAPAYRYPYPAPNPASTGMQPYHYGSPYPNYPVPQPPTFGRY